MSLLYQEIIPLLVTYPGNLTYHLVLTFSIAGALQSAITKWRKNNIPQAKRMVMGLSLLLVIRIILFFVAALAIQSLPSPSTIIPVLDRAISVLCTITIIWLWVFPSRSRLGDSTSLILTLITLALFALSAIWWNAQPQNIFFNSTWMSMSWNIFSILIYGFGLVLIYIRQPAGWEYGAMMFVILFLGHALQLSFPLPLNNHFEGIVRFAEMAAYPLLLIMPNTLPPKIEKKDETKTKAGEKKIQVGLTYSLLPRIIQNIFHLVLNDRVNIPSVIATIIGQTMLADYTLITSPIEDGGIIKISGGYDLIREENISQTAIDGTSASTLLSALTKGEPLILSPKKKSKDLNAIKLALGLTNSGHLLAHSMFSTNGEIMYGIILLSPFSSRAWNEKDLSFLNDLSKSIVLLTEHHKTWLKLEDSYNILKRHYNALDKEYKNIQGEKEILKNNIKKNLIEKKDLESKLKQLSIYTLQKSKQEKSKVAAIETARNTAQREIERLTQVNKDLEDKILKFKEQLNKSQNIQSISEKLDFVLNEISSLRKDVLLGKEEGGQNAKEIFRGILFHEGERSKINQRVESIQQSLNTINGFTDFLLGETAGSLTALQQHPLERIKTTSLRMSKDLNDLLDTINGIYSLNKLSNVSKEINLSEIVQQTIAEIQGRFRDKHISLKIDIPDNLPLFIGNYDSLKQAFKRLLNNAFFITPNRGYIIFKANIQETGTWNQQNYTLIQIIDQGGGIPPEELNNVFSKEFRLGKIQIAGVGDSGANLSVAKTIIEAHGGYIWVESDYGTGTTFNIILPNLNTNNHKEDSA